MQLLLASLHTNIYYTYYYYHCIVYYGTNKIGFSIIIILLINSLKAILKFRFMFEKKIASLNRTGRI